MLLSVLLTTCWLIISMYSQYDSKIIVVGAGMSGLVASVRAQQLGAEVVLIEKSAATGGTMAMSGGSIWCPTSFEGLLELVAA